MASVTIERVEKAYGSHKVMHGIDVHVEQGEFTALVGPSGCGKSTLLRMIAGLETISAGRIRIGERVVNDLEPRERDIAMVFQNYALYPHMTVAQNMGFSLRLAGASKADRDRQVREAARILDIEPLLDRLPKQLSGGQRQRVAMGRAIVRNPEVFLFDEPLSNLDAQLRVQMRAEIKRLHRRIHTTTIYVTHDQVEAMTMADKIVVLRAGRVEQIGSPMDLYDRPANLFVAGFIGSPAMNLLRGTLQAGSEAQFVMDGSEPLRVPVSADLPAGRPIVLGLRPEDLVPVAEGGLAGRVTNVEPTGSEALVTVAVGQQELLYVERRRGSIPDVDDAVRLHVNSQAVHVFDGEGTGLRMN